MIPVDQSVTNHNPAEGRYGDCMRASVASIFEVALEAVPDLSAKTCLDADAQAATLSEWSLARGFQFLWICMSSEHLPGYQRLLARNGARTFHILSGTSKRGFAHACVGMNGELAHDPHPDRTGVEPEDGLYWLGLFLPEPALITEKRELVITPNQARLNQMAGEVYQRRAAA